MSVDTPHPDLRAASRPGRPWTPPGARPLVPVASAIPVASARGRAALRRRAALLIGVAALGGGALLAVTGEEVGRVPAAGAAAWDLEVSSGGPRALTAVVFGREAGLHVVRVPAAGATAAERRRVAARLGAGDVYLVSLGRDPLAVETTASPGSAPMAFGARSRFVKLFSDARGTGVRTGWW